MEEFKDKIINCILAVGAIILITIPITMILTIWMKNFDFRIIITHLILAIFSVMLFPLLS